MNTKFVKLPIITWVVLTKIWDKITVHQTKNELFKTINIWERFESLMVTFVTVSKIAF